MTARTLRRAALFAAALALAACASRPTVADLGYRVPDVARRAPEAASGYTEKPGWSAREPLCFDYKAWRLCGMPPPSSGPLALGQMLGMLAPRRIETMVPAKASFGLEPSADAVHLISEAGRLAYADRARDVADPDFVPLPGGNAAVL